MNKTSVVVLLLFSMSIFTFMACNQTDKKSEDPFADAQTISLTNENVSLKLPKSFKRSSRYTLPKDLPMLASDTVAMMITQRALEALEFEDAEIDVFVDTNSNLNFLVIINIRHAPFDKDVAAVLNQQIQNSYQQMVAFNPNLQAEKLVSTMQGTNAMKSMKFKHKITFLPTDQSQYETIFFVTTEYRSYAIRQISIELEDIGDFIWSIKD